MADDRLTPGDLATFPILIRIQNDIGPGVTPLTQAGVWDFMVQLDVLARQQYPQIHNGPLKGWVDGIFTSLITTPTVYPFSVTGLYILSGWARWLADKPVSDTGLDCMESFGCFLGVPDSGKPWQPWQGPDTPGYWRNAVDSVCSEWRSDEYIPWKYLWQGPWHTIQDQIACYEAFFFSPSQWTNVRVVSSVVGKVTAAQSADLHALLTGGPLTFDTALLLIWLLLFVVTFSGTADQRMAVKILSASASSPEYPNDIFANQFVYLMLMTLADPLGNFGWPNATLQSTVQSLIAAIPRDDPASVALKQSLTNHLKVLVSDSSYPTQDLYNPNISFPVRQTDTLAALNRAWATLSH